ncbi:MAG: HAMP domain-containing histidine kinase [Opitutales bacterium]|jgi:two-component system, OmpR family, heavy metal sensor histidine kinase CusS|nr:HAMP domain-containing histidine kinase [Opitutales bacterium]
MRVSFKFKIALLSLAISGTLLTAFGLFFFAFAYKSGIDRMDQEIRTLAESSLRGPRPRHYWDNFDKSLDFIYGEAVTTRIALYIVDADREERFASENAPPELVELVLTLDPAPASDSKAAQDEAPHFAMRHEPPRSRLDDDYFDLDLDEGRLRSMPDIGGRGDARRPGGPPQMSEPTTESMIDPVFQTLETADGSWRVGTFQVPGMLVMMAMDMEVFYHDIRRFQTAFLIAVPVGLVLLALAGWFLAGRAMRPVASIADTAEGITAKGLDRRIPMVGSDTELERLVSVCNGMLDRLEKSYRQAVRFSADAAHELQTPLTILQGELDNAIQASEDGSVEQQRYSMLMEELSNLKAVVQKLLLLAHADEGRLKLNLKAVDLSEMVRTAAEDLEVMAPSLQIKLLVEDHVTVPADLALLNQALRNMTSNAAKYTELEGDVRFILERSGGVAHFTVENRAAAIPEEDRLQVFERFHRVEKSRTTAGSGLGLSLAREIVRAHQGDLVLKPYHEGMVAFTLTLPLA